MLGEHLKICKGDLQLRETTMYRSLGYITEVYITEVAQSQTAYSSSSNLGLFLIKHKIKRGKHKKQFNQETQVHNQMTRNWSQKNLMNNLQKSINTRHRYPLLTYHPRNLSSNIYLSSKKPGIIPEKLDYYHTSYVYECSNDLELE